MRHWDGVIIGAGIIGLSLAIELNKRGMKVLVVEKGEPGREASWAAGGMLADFFLETPPALHELATASARMFPEFVHGLQDESRMHVDLRDHGAIVFLKLEKGDLQRASVNVTQLKASYPLPRPLQELEPAFDVSGKLSAWAPLFLHERSVDPRHLTAAAVTAAKHRAIDFSSGNAVVALTVADGKATGVRTSKTQFSAGIVVNCAGAWAGKINRSVSGVTGKRPVRAASETTTLSPIPARPVKGQMLCLVMPKKELVRHVVRTPEVYLIPRSDGRMLIGATQEEAGFNKQTVPETIQKLRAAALDVVPTLAEARFLESWAGLRPGTPDDLPILGATSTPGYFVATGHFRDGILLAPVTARVMGQVIAGEQSEFDLTAFAASRF